ncbi:MAG: hypothetical protein Alis3KO_41160 [Aliiglaciecola sp.]
MGTLKGKTEGGSGGKRGHSNMTHWAYTEELKESSNVNRRNNSKKIIREELKQDDVQSKG